MCLQLLFGDEGSREDRIFHDFEETVSLIGWKGSFQIGSLGLQQVVGVEIALQLIAEFARMKLCIAVWHCHEGWLADTGQAIVFLHQRLDFLGCHVAEETAEPVLQVAADASLQRLAVPGKV